MGDQIQAGGRSHLNHRSRRRAAVGRLVVASAATVATARLSQAAVYVFDPLQSTTSGTDGSSTWDNGVTTTSAAPPATDWFNTSGGTNPTVWSNSTADTALFGVGGSAGTVTVDPSGVSVGTVQFNSVTGSYLLTGGPINLGGAATISLTNAASGTFAITPTINSVLTGSSGLNIQGNSVQNASQGVSILTLGGANTYSGVTNISGGVAVSVSTLAAGGNFGNTTGIVLNGTVGTLPTVTGVAANAVLNTGAQLIYTGAGIAATSASVGLTLAGNILDTINVSNASTVLNFAGPVTVATANAGGILNKQGAGTLGFTNATNTFNYLYVSSGTLNLGTGTGAAQADTINNSAGGNTLVVGYTNLEPAGASATSPNVATLNILSGATVTVTGQGLSLANSNLSSSSQAPINQLNVLNVSGILNNSSTLSTFSGAVGAGDVAVINVLPGGTVNVPNVKFSTAALTTTATVTGTTYLNVIGGSFNVSAPTGSASDSLIRFQGTDYVNLSAGQLYFGGNINLTGGANASSQTSIINQTGGTFNASGFVLGFNSGIGTYNLSGGTLLVNSIATNGTPLGGSGFIFNGGTLQARAAGAPFFVVPTGAGMLGAQIGTGGGTIDTQAFNLAIAQPFVTGVPGGTDGGLTKIGTGTLTLTGVSTYTGTTNVGTTTAAGGKLVVLGSLAGPVAVTAGVLDGTGTVGAVTVAAGAGNTIANGNGSTGTLTTTGNLSFLGAANGSIGLSASNLAATNTPAVAVGGTLSSSAAGPVTLNLRGAITTGSSYDLFSYTNGFSGTLSGSTPTDFVIGSGISGRALAGSSLTVTSTTGSGFLVLNVGSADTNIRWSGATDNTWRTGQVPANTNWSYINASSGTATPYFDGDNVTFDNNGANTNPVNISAATVSPASVTFNNSSASYTVSSTGGFGIGGSGTLTKNGSGGLTINTSNSYAGGTTLNAGTLNVGNVNALSSGPLTISGGTIDNSSGSTLQLSNGTIAINNSFTFGGTAQLNTGGGNVTLSNNPTITVNGTGQLFFPLAISGTSSLTLAGTGTTTLQTISKFNSSNGVTAQIGTLVSGGTLNLKLFFAPGVTNTNNNGGGTALLPGPLNISSGATVNANFINALGYNLVSGVVTTLTVNGTFNDYVNSTQGLFTNVVLGGGSILERNAPAAGNPGNFTFNVNASSGTLTSITTTAGSPLSTFTMGVALANGGTFPINAASDLLITGPISQVTGPGSINKTGNGTLTVQDGYAAGNTFAGGTTITAGTIRINELKTTPVNLLGTGTTNILSGATLGGNGSSGGPVVVAGTITGGVDGVTTGTLTTSTETWSSGGGYVSKIVGSSNDMLVMSGLTINSASGSAFTVFLNGSSGAALTTSGTVLATVTTGTAGYIQTAINTNALVLSATGVSVPNGYVPALQEVDVGNNLELVAFATAAAPEPTSLLLLGLAGAPLALGRRRVGRGQAVRHPLALT